MSCVLEKYNVPCRECLYRDDCKEKAPDTLQSEQGAEQNYQEHNTIPKHIIQDLVAIHTQLSFYHKTYHVLDVNVIDKSVQLYNDNFFATFPIYKVDERYSDGFTRLSIEINGVAFYCVTDREVE